MNSELLAIAVDDTEVLIQTFLGSEMGERLASSMEELDALLPLLLHLAQGIAKDKC